ncbi:N-acetylmuramoyl-L-alanine amidase-like domain-containing protein [Pyxidicoccus caerfyrddinensis]|uniref:N-acetylmuramoyl-L-alanine amidase-like domain-containing protein n=1 Tax=Pyxidicoccus caerfyrddinensis TaxID=2709663 RepID=UPI0013DBEF24|nr:N-acetylmuramoyl-L-alanine amidase-like domain-containing protein [Pyxidicoccus caerfyrddinensis]
MKAVTLLSLALLSRASLAASPPPASAPPAEAADTHPGAEAILESPAASAQAATSTPHRPNGWEGLTAEQRAALVAEDPDAPLPERVLRMSERFINTPYVLSPLGEGQGVDPDPTFRLDAVDCLTFVEQSVALGLARSEPEVAPLLEHLRYASSPSYEDRNHLMEAQWLPNNIRKGFLVDVTRRYAGEDAVGVTKTLTPLTWQSRSSAALALPKERRPVGTYPLNMLPLERVLTHARSIPSGTILVVLREDLPLKATRVTHLGFVVQRKKRTYLRHASRGGYNRVVDEDLETFLARNARYAKWKVTGVSLFEVRRPDAPASAMRSP